MSLISRGVDAVKSVAGSDGDGMDDDMGVAEDVQTDVEEKEGFSISEEDREEQVEEDDSPGPWDSAYDFCVWALEPHGFPDGRSIAAKSMMWHLERSNMYRDRIESGMNAVDSVTSSLEGIKELRGGDDEDKDYEKLADELEAADRVIGAVEGLSGKDDMITQQMLSVGQSLADGLARQVSPDTGDIDSNVRQREGSLE